MSLRDNFHALCKTGGLDVSGHIGDWSSDFEYDHSHIQIMWEGFQAGAASRDAEVVSLTNQRDYEYVRAENAEQDRLLIKIAPEDAEIAGLMDDAARYRFLRKFLSSKDLPILTGRGECNEPDEQYAIDCVVDVAIARARKP